MEKQPERAMGLAMVLMFVPVLLIMVGALIQAVWGQLQATRQVYDQTAALYLAEAGIVDAVTQLEIDPSWTAGFANKRIPGVDGDYSMRFHTSAVGPWSPDESVNNLDGSRPDNYRGASAVPTGTVSMVVTARVGAHQRQLEALVRLGGGLYPTDVPVLTAGKVALKGNVQVDGIKSQSDSTAVNGGIHSNFVDPGLNLVAWDGTGSALVTGKVSSSGSAPGNGAVNMTGATLGMGVQGNAAAKPLPRIDILTKIAAKSGAPQPAILPVGTSTVGSGDFYLPGDVVVNGDLVLNGARLHVNGNLTVNGAIRGDGSLYIKGNSIFKGDAAVSASSPDKVALFSHGAVQLSGFDGTAYMNALAGSNAAFATAWTQSQDAIRDLEAEFKAPSPRLGQGNYADQVRSELGYPGTCPARPGKQTDNLGILITQLNAQPASSARSAMLTKLTNLRDSFYAFGNGSAQELNALANLNQKRVVTGCIDGLIDNNAYSSLTFANAYLDGINYNKLGTSYFQGLVYTHGAFHASNEVDIRGAVVVDNDGTQPPLTVGADTLQAGDLYLMTGSRLTYVEDFFKPSTPGPGGSSIQVILWMGR